MNGTPSERTSALAARRHANAIAGTVPSEGWAPGVKGKAKLSERELPPPHRLSALCRTVARPHAGERQETNGKRKRDHPTHR